MAEAWKEEIGPDEEARFQALAKLIGDWQRQNNAGVVPLRRALHAKTHAGLVARLQVPDLPVDLRHGLFAKPGTYDAFARLSNGAPRRQFDSVPDVRGAGLKILGVEGRKLMPGFEDAKTQDFLFIQTAASPFRDATEFATFVRIFIGPSALVVPRLVAALGPRRMAGVVRWMLRGMSWTAQSLAEQHFFTSLPIQYGPHAAKFQLAPHAQSTLRSELRVGGMHALRDELVARVQASDIVFDLRAQLFVDAERTPIEDSLAEWSEDVSPYRTVARLVIPQQDPLGDRGARVESYVDRLGFDPWHALVEHRPLGSLMRARRFAYPRSQAQRGSIDENAVTTVA